MSSGLKKRGYMRPKHHFFQCTTTGTKLLRSIHCESFCFLVEMNDSFFCYKIVVLQFALGSNTRMMLSVKNVLFCIKISRNLYPLWNFRKFHKD